VKGMWKAMKSRNKKFLSVLLIFSLVVASLVFPGIIYAEPDFNQAVTLEETDNLDEQILEESLIEDDASLDTPEATFELVEPDETEVIQEQDNTAAVLPSGIPTETADKVFSNGIVISDMVVTPVSSGVAKVSLRVTNNTSELLSKTNTIAYYKGLISKDTYLFHWTLKSDVKPGTSEVMTFTFTFDQIANLPLTARIFDNGTKYPVTKPANLNVQDSLGHTTARPFDPAATVSISDVKVTRADKNTLCYTYKVTNNTDKKVLKSSYISLYKNSVDSKNFIAYRNLKQDVAPGESVIMSETITAKNNDTYQLAIRLFDVNSTNVKLAFPYLGSNLFYDGQIDNKVAYETEVENSTVSISDLKVKKITSGSVSLTYTITNNANGPVYDTVKLGVYEGSIDKTNLLGTISLGKNVLPGQSVEITKTISAKNIAQKFLVIRLFDNGKTFPYFAPNSLTDKNMDNKVVEGKPYKYKVVCVGDSLTEGYGVKTYNNYPSQLQAKLGDDYAVVNCGVSGRTANSAGDYPYKATLAYQKAKLSDADIVLFMLGSNDARIENRSVLPNFKSEYAALVSEFVNLPSGPKVFVAKPVAVVKNTERLSEVYIAQYIRPQIGEVAAELGLECLDYSTLLPKGQGYYIRDGKHPSRKGHNVLSDEFCKAVKGYMASL